MGSSSEHFRTSFVRLIQTRPANWGTVWRLIVEHPWYQQQLHACAERLLRRFACRSQSVDDVKHEAMLLLARDVERTTDLGLNASEAGAHFVGWMRTIIARHCRQVFRRARRRDSRQRVLHDSDHLAFADESQFEWRELLQAINHLDEPDLTALTLLLKGFNKTEISAHMNLTYERTRYVINRGLKNLSLMIRETSET
jgi:DNA-directed RNA polymerase specialized sigma24 family protein